VRDEETGALHRELEGFPSRHVETLASFLSADGQQPRLVAGSFDGRLVIYNPEAGSVLHTLRGHTNAIRSLACIASSSAAPHHPRLVSTCYDGAIKVWDGETGEMLAELQGHGPVVMALAVWKEHTGGHDRIAATGDGGRVRVWDGEAWTLLHDLDCGPCRRLLAFKSAEGPAHLLVGIDPGAGLQVWDPEEGRRLHHGINRGCPLNHCHLFESAQGRHLLAIQGRGEQHPRHPGESVRAFVDVWDMGEAPAADEQMRPANKQG
jgi:WD40 repeat protein